MNGEIFDDLALDQVLDIERLIRHAVQDELPDLCERIQAGSELTEADRGAILQVARKAKARSAQTHGDVAPSRETMES